MTAIKKSLFAENYSNQFLYIEELDGNASADFLISSLIVDQLRTNPSVGMCLVLFQNTFSHYSNICARTSHKLNLMELSQKNQITCVQALDILVEDFNKPQCLTKEDGLSSLYFAIEASLNKLLENQATQVYLIIECVNNLLYIEHPLKSVINLIQNCYNAVLNQTASTLVISSHVCDSNSEQKSLSAYLKHLANINFRVSGLKTGFSSEVSGNFLIERKNDVLYNFSVKRDKFYFKFEDNFVLIYDGIAPNFLK